MALPETIKLTYDDYCSLPSDGRRHEVVEGQHYVSPSPTARHQQISAELFFLLKGFVQSARLGVVLYAPLDVVADPHNVVQPDLFFVARENLRIVTEKNIQGAPDLIVEILSESNRRLDELVKRSLYERIGVREYWIVDPELDRIKVLRARDGRFERVAELSLDRGDSLESDLIPGLRIDLATVFPPR